MNAALQFIPATLVELPSYTNARVFSRKGFSSALSAAWWPVYTSQLTGSSVFRRLQVHIVAPALLPGALHSWAAPAFTSIHGEQQSRAQCSQEHENECALIPGHCLRWYWSIYYKLATTRGRTGQQAGLDLGAPACLIPFFLLYCCCPEVSLHCAQVTSP